MRPPLAGNNGTRFYDFDGFRVDARSRLLLKEGRVVPLTGKVFEILVVFVQNPGRVLDKKELMESIWPDSFVEEGNLTRNISTLRHALGELPSERRYIVTIPGRGYSFVAQVNETKSSPPLLIRESFSAQIIDEEEVIDEENGVLLPSPRNVAETGLMRQGQNVMMRVQAEPADLSSQSRNKLYIAMIGLVCLIAGIATGIITYRAFNRRHDQKTGTPELVKLTTSGRVTVAAVSPNGGTFAYVENNGGLQKILLKQVASAQTLELVPASNTQYDGLVFSREGDYLYFVSIDRGRSSGPLYQISSLGGTPRKIIDDVWDGPISFSPDGQRFAFVRDSPNSSQESALMIADVTGKHEQQIGVRKLLEHFSRLAWSPDGKLIACVVHTADSSGASETIVGVSVADGHSISISPQRWTLVGHIKWLNDMSGLLITARDKVASLPFQIWSISYPEGATRRITSDFNGYTALSLTADSSRILTVQSSRISNIWIVPNHDVAQAVRVTSGASRYPGFSFTNDNNLVYASQASGNLDIWSMRSDGSDQRRLTVDSHSDWLPVASPDGRYVVFASDRTGTAHLWRMNADGTDEQQLTFGSSEDRASFSPDSKWVVYSSGDANSLLWRVPISGGEPIQITDKNMTHPVVSPDGKLIACNYRDEATGKWLVAVIPFEGGAPLKLLDIPITVDGLPSVRWSSDSSSLIFIETSNEVSNLKQQPLDGKPATRITDFQTDRIYSFTTSQDGKVIACSRGNGYSDVVMVSNFR